MSVRVEQGWDRHPQVEPGWGRWTVCRGATFTGAAGEQWTVPVGMSTDLASVPRWLRGVVDSWGTYTLAAILHDWLCRIARGDVASWDPVRDRVHGKAVYDGSDVDVSARYVTRREADGLFLRVMRLEGVSQPQRRIMWLAVRLGSGFSGGMSWRDAWATAGALPLGLLVSVLALPSWVGRTLLRVLGSVTTRWGW